MKSRFIVKPVKIVWRNSMIAGNPITHSFTKFGVFDRNWENDRFCCCPRPGGEWATNNGQSRKYRIVVDDEALAKLVADKLNAITVEHKANEKQLKFGQMTDSGLKPLSQYISAEEVPNIVLVSAN